MAPLSQRKAFYPTPFACCVGILVLGHIVRASPVAPPLNKDLYDDTPQSTASSPARNAVRGLPASAPLNKGANEDSSLAPTTSLRPQFQHFIRGSGRATFETKSEPKLVLPSTVARPYTFSVTRSVHPRNRTFIAIVLTTPPANGSNVRLDHFIASWQATWPELQWHTQICLRNHPKLRGYNLLSASATALHTVAASAPDFDYLLMFEDDAMAFQGTRWPNQAENDLDAQLDVLARKNGTGMLLGGHDIEGYSVEELNIARKLNNSVVRATAAWGSYAMIIPSWNVIGLRDEFTRAVAAKTSVYLASDDVNWSYWNSETTPGTGGYISVPLLVDHPPGFSLTWLKQRKNAWIGHRDWWTLPTDRRRKKRRGRAKFVLLGTIVAAMVTVAAVRFKSFRSLFCKFSRTALFRCLLIGALLFIVTSAAIPLSYNAFRT